MKKGYTLVEALVSMVVFSLMFGVCLTSYLIGAKFHDRQNEYLFFESICLDINEYSTKYRNSWNIYYFNDEETIQYYTKDYQSTEERDFYTLEFYYNDTNQLIVNIFETESNRFIIKELNYGSDRYV